MAAAPYLPHAGGEGSNPTTRSPTGGGPLDRVDGVKAAGIFFLSLSLALGLGFGFSVLSGTPRCDYPIILTTEHYEGGLRTTVTSVEGEYAVEEVEYLVLELDESVTPVVDEGKLTEAMTRTDGVVYWPGDPESGVLREGDTLVVDSMETQVGVLLLTEGGTPLGWTEGC